MSKSNPRIYIAIATASLIIASFSVCAAQTMPNITNDNRNTNTNSNTNTGGTNTNTNTNTNTGPSNPIVTSPMFYPAYSYQTYQTYAPRPWSYGYSASYSYAYPTRYYYPQSYGYPQNYMPQNYVSLSQIPYTGFDFGPWGNTLYWLGLIAFAFAGAYLVTYYSKGTLLGTKSIIRTWALRLDSLRGARSW